MNVAVINYNAGNTQSVVFALERLGVNALLTDEPSELLMADKVIFPGVGEASSAMNYLMERNLDTLIRMLRQPLLGICLGMQLLCKNSEEGQTNCLGIFDSEVRLFRGKEKIPQMGWNTIYNLKSSLFDGIEENTWQYFVHSYYAETSADTIATAEYIIPFSAALQKDNFYGVQFHPEKSGDPGSRIIENFLKYT